MLNFCLIVNALLLLGIRKSYSQTNDGQDSAWTEANVPIYLDQPYFSDTFENHASFLSGLPQLYSSFSRISNIDIIQNTVPGLELSLEGSVLIYYFCQDGYEIKGFNDAMLMCSRFHSQVPDYFDLGTSKCQLSLGSCDIKEARMNSINGENMALTKRMGNGSSGRDEEDSEESDEATDNKDPGETSTNVRIYKCVKDKSISMISVCRNYGVQGFKEFEITCASSQNSTERVCVDCEEEKFCLVHQYACGVLVVNQAGEVAPAIICCTIVDQNSAVISMANVENNGNSASQLLEENIRQHFNMTNRNTFASVQVIAEGPFGFFFLLCPPDFYLQGYNGQQMLCSKEVHVVELEYSVNTYNECKQKICFPEDEEIDCITSPSPKFKICQKTHISALISPVEHKPCQGSDIYSNTLHDRGLSCDDESVQPLCESQTFACGIVVTKFLPNWLVKGLICCSTEQVPKFIEEYADQNQEELLYFYERFKMEKSTMTLQTSNNEMSRLFNKLIQENMDPNEALESVMSPLYNRKMWLLEEIWAGSPYPETFIMCPSNTYVRGVEITLTDEAFIILCSEDPPNVEGLIEVKLLDQLQLRVCNNIHRGHDFISCTHHLGGSYQFCTNGKTWAPRLNTYQRCYENPCGENGEVCGVTNSAYTLTSALVVCCESHTKFPSRIPEAFYENGNLSTDAIKYVVDRLTKEYQTENNGQRGTLEEILAYHRKKNDLRRTLSAVSGTDMVSTEISNVIASGGSLAEAFELLGQTTNFKYWALDEDYKQLIDRGFVPKVVMCPNGSYVRGRSAGSVLCSEGVPNIGKIYTKILGAEATCIMTSSRVNNNADYYVCTDTQSEYHMCSRGYYGLNTINSAQVKCSDASWCQDNGENNAGICGLIYLPGRFISDYEKGICCTSTLI